MQPNPPLEEDKVICGTKHLDLLPLIVSMSVLDKYGLENRWVHTAYYMRRLTLFLSFADDVQAKKYKITHKSPPMFLYDMDQWNVWALDQGLFKGYYIVRVSWSRLLDVSISNLLFYTDSTALIDSASYIHKSILCIRRSYRKKGDQEG